MVTASSILGVPKRPAKPSDVLRPVDLDSLAERVAALSVRATHVKEYQRTTPSGGVTTVRDYDVSRIAPSRFKPYEFIQFQKPLTGPNGASLTAYEWKYKLEEVPHDTEGMIVKRVSDWDAAEESSETGRGLVHHFHVKDQSGNVSLVSSESVPAMLGYVEKNQSPSLVKSVISHTKTLAKLKLKHAISSEKHAAWKAAEEQAEKETVPAVEYRGPAIYEVGVRKGELRGQTFGAGDFDYGITYEPHQDSVDKLSWDQQDDIRRGWRYKRAMQIYGGSPPSPVEHRDLERRIKRQERKIADAIAGDEAAVKSSDTGDSDLIQARDLSQPAPQLSTDIRSGADQLHRDAVRKALAVAEANALANAEEVDDAKAKKRREEAAALALLLLGAAGAASYASLLPLLLRQAVASAPSAPTGAQEPTAVPPVSLPTGEPATEPTATVLPAEPEPALPTPEQEADALGGKTLEEAAQDFADSRAEFLKPFCADIQEAMRLEVEVGKANGESIHQIGRRLFDLANGIGGSRGAVLAAAEAQSAYGHAQLRALVAAGYRKANWVQVDRPTKRDSHAANAAAGPLRLGDTWPNGQKFPGDPIGGPAENCNCLCMLVGADWHKPKPERVLTRRQKLRKERLAKKQAAKASDQTPSEAVKAALPKFGCLMAMLPELAAGLASVASQIPKEDLAEDGVETEPHATVLYGFSLDFDAQKLPEVLSGFGPFEARLGKLSRFECPEYDVVKFEVVSDRLRALNAKLAESFKGDITPSKWDYNPHVTVAYVKKGAAQDLDGSKLEGRTFEVRDLLYSLPEKQGRVEFALGEPAKASLPDLSKLTCRARRKARRALKFGGAQ